ncbi:putative leucine-rich repeat receptor-like serine/threonine-protein kinase At2g19230 [Phragmites australis]|uniref:putative leucine-rich repeat receptor-like serine/threonine-protein kinase At2g19230 n=1 Tax=Phragmites australis TaxID=29695 RepID=UPI002D771FD7|nr:putative leucine-rich repeat receptor-like serine/threonine-protein kinase At2g19230 [Phragmites australis]
MALPTAMQFLVLLCLAAASGLIAVIHGQLDSPGFISIDCGIAADRTYSDQSTSGLLYVSDAGFTDAGLNAGVKPPYDSPDMAERYRTVRYFPGSARSCYTLRPVTPGGRYLVRAAFYYGNYDGLNRLPAFDLHLGVNRWATVNVTAADDRYILEAVAVSPADFLQVCLVNTELGTPFISGLDLRLLRATMYPDATVNQSLLLLSLARPSATFGFNRYQFWPAGYPLFRTPFDPYDRLWQRFGNVAAWTNITTSATVDVSNISSFDKPSVILQSAATPVNGTRIDFTWISDPTMNNDNSAYILLLYFTELQRLPSNELRRFDILVDNTTWNGSQGFTPKYLSAEIVKRMVQGSGQHTVSLVGTPDATLPPTLNAFEIYSVKPMTELETNDVDAKAMMTIRTKYALKKNWMGDPCAPKAFAWDGLNCSFPSSGPAWITALRLSSSGLTGDVDSSFGDLKSLQYLDLSNNSLSGPVPDFLAQIPSLTFLDLSSNKLSGLVPAVLLEKRQNGSLVLRTGNNANLCDNGASTCEPEKKKSNRTLVIATVVPIGVATLLFVAALFILHRLRKRQDTWMANNSRLNSPRDGSNILENRKFTYKELKLMTANFREEIGRGGFGAVFLGYLENEIPVAVKMRSKTSSQGDKEFLAEAHYLTRVHHRNLVSLIGYCKDKKHLALVYEYMHGGNLEDHLRGEASAATPLTWHQRLKIALDSAQGLEYLHKSCQPPLIHRDVKTKNILLSADLKAKISDFGLMKAFTDEFKTHVTTQPAGTLGYLDPEYYNTAQLSEKSDVYSFGVVLLELITGQPPAVPISNTESIHVALWVRQKLSEGDIASIADPRMGGEYDVNSVWKVAELALQCKEQPSRERPTMTDVVVELKESLELEVSHAMGYYSSTPSSSINLNATSIDLCSDAQPSDHPGQEAALELKQEGIASATHIGPAQR